MVHSGVQTLVVGNRCSYATLLGIRRMVGVAAEGSRDRKVAADRLDQVTGVEHRRKEVHYYSLDSHKVVAASTGLGVGKGYLETN
jgi:hypothetical protein